jgi:hypothetical protein
MRRDDEIRLRHMQDAARETVQTDIPALAKVVADNLPRT